MAIIGALDQTKHFSEFGNLLQTNTGFLTGEMRKKIARANLEIYGGLDIGVANPLMFGAVGDGVHDDTHAIQAMIAYGSNTIDWLNETYTWLITDTLVITRPHTVWTGTAKIHMNRSALWCKPMVIVMQSATDSYFADTLHYDHDMANTPASTRTDDLAQALGAAILVMSDRTHFGGYVYNAFDVGIGFVDMTFTGDGSVATPYHVTNQNNGHPIANSADFIYGFNCGCGQHTYLNQSGNFNQGAAVDILTASSTNVGQVIANQCYAGVVVDFNSQANAVFGSIATLSTKQDSRLPGGSGVGIYCGDYMTVGSFYSNNDVIGIIAYNTQFNFTCGSAFIWAPGQQGVLIAGGVGRFAGRFSIGAAGRTNTSVAFQVNANTSENIILDVDLSVWSPVTGTTTYGYSAIPTGGGKIQGRVQLVMDNSYTTAPFISSGNELIDYVDLNGNRSQYSNTAGRFSIGGQANASSASILQLQGQGIDFTNVLPVSMNYNLYWDGTNWRHENSTTGMIIRFEPSDTSIDMYYAAAGTPGAIASLVQISKFSATGIQFSTPLGVGSGGTGTATSTGSGSVVLNNGPVLIAPALGTPSSVTLTNATGLPLTSGVTGVLPPANGGTGVTSTTGTGSAVLNNSPTLVTPALGTPSALVLTNATGLPLNTGVTGTLPAVNGGSGGNGSVTGSGANVLQTSPTINSPTLTAPALGTPASGVMTNVTGLPLTSGVTGVLPTANGGATAMGQGTSNMSGTWTPSLTFGSNSTGITYSSRTGTWTRLGNLVFVTCSITLTSKGTATGVAGIGGLSSPNPASYACLGVIGLSMGTYAASKALMVAGSTSLNFYITTATGEAAMTDTAFTNSSIVIVTGVYDIGSLT